MAISGEKIENGALPRWRLGIKWVRKHNFEMFLRFLWYLWASFLFIRPFDILKDKKVLLLNFIFQPFIY